MLGPHPLWICSVAPGWCVGDHVLQVNGVPVKGVAWRRTRWAGSFATDARWTGVLGDSHGVKKHVPYVTQWCFRAGNLVSGPDFGRILVEQVSESALRPAFARPEGRS